MRRCLFAMGVVVLLVLCSACGSKEVRVDHTPEEPPPPGVATELPGFGMEFEAPPPPPHVQQQIRQQSDQ